MGHPAGKIGLIHFEIIGELTQVEVIAAGLAIRERRRLWKAYGRGAWRKLKGVANIKLKGGTCVLAELHGTKPMALARENSKSNGSSRPQSKSAVYVLCVSNKNHPASLERGKVYPRVRDTAAGKQRLLRVIDESGEDYLYPEHYFVAVRLPASAKLALSKAS